MTSGMRLFLVTAKFWAPMCLLLPWFLTVVGGQDPNKATRPLGLLLYWGLPMSLFGRTENGVTIDPNMTLHAFVFWALVGAMVGFLGHFAARTGSSGNRR